MALPAITLPADLLPWLTTPHEVEEEDVYGYIENQTGPTRTRRLYTTANRVMRVSMILNQKRLESFHLWYENSILAGLLPFSIQVQDFGPGLVWFKAYMPTYRSDHQSGTDYTILSAEVYLVGDPDYSVLGPDTGLFSVAIYVPVDASATTVRPVVNFAVDMNVYVFATVGFASFSYFKVNIGEIPIDAIMLAEGLLPPGVILRQSRRDYTPPLGDAVLLRQRILDYTPPTVII